jgi:hypothetical protein
VIFLKGKEVKNLKMDLFSVETSIKVKHMVMVPYRIWMDLLITEIFKTEKLVGKEV